MLGMIALGLWAVFNQRGEQRTMLDDVPTVAQRHPLRHITKTTPRFGGGAVTESATWDTSKLPAYQDDPLEDLWSRPSSYGEGL